MLLRYDVLETELLELQDQSWQVILNDSPMSCVVDLIIVVHDNITQTNDPTPLDVRMA